MAMASCATEVPRQIALADGRKVSCVLQVEGAPVKTLNFAK